MRNVPLLIFTIIIAVFFVALYGGNPQHIPSPLIDKAAPEFSNPLLFKKGFLTNKDLQKNKIILLNVWASWCVPCRSEHPHLMALERKGVPIFGINYKDESEAAKQFIKTRGNPFKKIGVDKTGSTAFAFGVYGVPETFILDSQGKIIARLVGEITETRINAAINN